MAKLPQNFPTLHPGGSQSSLAITEPTVVKNTPGVLNCFNPAAASTTVTINDASSVANANAGNVIFEGSISQLSKCDWPCASGIVVSAVTGAVSVAFT